MPKQKTALLVRAKDKRTFFTTVKNTRFLIEFARTFGAELSVVLAPEATVMKLSQVINSFCDGVPGVKTPYRVIRQIWPNSGLRDKMLRDAVQIQKYIRRKLTAGKVVSLAEIRNRFSELQLTDACFSNHLARARRDFGKQVKRIGHGRYRLSV